MQSPCHAHRSCDRLAGEGGLEHSRRLGREHRSGADGAVHLDVIGMTVAATRVVADEHIGVLLVEHCGDAPGDREPVGTRESMHDLAVESGVRVAEGHQPVHAEHGCGLLELGRAHGGEVVDELAARQPGSAVGGDDEHDPLPGSSRARHGSRGEQRLVIGMRVHEDQGSGWRVGCHRAPILPYLPIVRIAHISDCYLPRTGGIETQVRALAMQQHASGQDVRILTATPGASVRSGGEVLDGIPVERITARIPGDLPIHPRTRAHVHAVLTRDPVDVVHVHVGVISPFAWGAVRAAHQLGLPVLVTVHGVWGPLAAPGYRLSDVLTHWSRWGVQLSAVSQVAAGRIERAIPGSGPVLVLPNGIDPGAWLLPERQHDASTLNLVTVMRLAPRKRTLPLLRILQAARAQVGAQAHLQLRIVGDGPERTRAQAYVQQHGLGDAVAFAGRLDHRGIREVFAMSDAYVQASVRESFGIAALEARSAGLPVIARSQTGTAQFIRDGQEGLLASNDSGMSAAIARLALDRPLLTRLAGHNRSVPPEQSWPQVLDLVAAAYDRARALD